MEIKTEKNAASGSTVIDENRGRVDVRQNLKKRGTSKDVVASLDQRVAGVETSMTELKNQIEGLEGLDSDFTSMREDFRVSTLHQVIEYLQADMALCKRSLASGSGNTNHGLKIDLPKPSPFVGKRDARARRRYGDIERGMATIDTWAEFMVDFKKQFYPNNAKNETKSRLRKLKQSETIRYMMRELSKLKDQKVNQEKGGGENNARPKVDPTRKPPTRKDKNLKSS
ncbi:putative retrotransposon gag domain, aspartic peptidase domain protein [Tanacetum coccineum]